MTDSFSEDHVCCWHYQTRSQRLTCKLKDDADDAEAAASGDRGDDTNTFFAPWPVQLGTWNNHAGVMATDDDDDFSDDGRETRSGSVDGPVDGPSARPEPERVTAAVIHSEVVLGADPSLGVVREATAVQHRANDAATVVWTDQHFRRGQRDRRIRYRIAACRARAFAKLQDQSKQSLEAAAWAVAFGSVEPSEEALFAARVQLGDAADEPGASRPASALKSLASYFRLSSS